MTADHDSSKVHYVDPTDVHYRLWDPRDNAVTVVCVQDFDYPDYTNGRWINDVRYPTEEEAEDALTDLLQNDQKLINRQHLKMIRMLYDAVDEINRRLWG